jgi:Asp-tRNA(Asn)/Glu-tRNA(Gln) amidotransferase A subunit family amidase
MAVLAGPTGSDINELPYGAVSLDPRRPQRVIACRTMRADVDADVERAFDATIDAIAGDLRIPVTRVDRVFTDPQLPFRWFQVSAAELAQSLAAYADRWDELESGLTDVLRFGASVGLDGYLESQRARYEAAAAIAELLGDDAVLITPTCNATSWAVEGPLASAAGVVTNDLSIAVNTVEFNFTGHPAVSVPIGVSTEGVPIGMQVAAPRFGDDLALGLAAGLEGVRPWRHTAPGYEPFPIF